MRPQRYGFQYITQAQQYRWECKYGDFWADTVEPEHRTTTKDFATEAEALAFVGSTGQDAPSGYCDRLFERVNIRAHSEGALYGYEWDEREIEIR